MAYVKCIRNLISSTVPDGKTVTPTDDISIWLACGGRSETYTTLSQVLADSACLSALINDNNAVDYLVRSTTWASSITADSSAMSYIGLNNYASNTLLADSTWCNAICNSTYFESVLNVKVPVMTSNNTPNGECFGSSYKDSSTEYYKAFDGNNSTCWTCATADRSPAYSYIGYSFTTPIKICKIFIKSRNDIDMEFKFEGSSNKTTWLEIAPNTQLPAGSEENIILASPANYQHFRAYGKAIISNRDSDVYSLQFYGRKDV